ncbi:glycosyl transferase family 1 [Bacillaceae bacterium SAS-127]|nr:glycosyl transferase family 1 [Bacillaceae bacterium SAS-127]
MRIMVFNVAAEHGGALSVLNDFYHEVLDRNDTNIQWIFVLSTATLQETDHIKVLRFPWVKKSWGHRFYFDQIIAPQLVKQHQADKIFSLQNMTVPRVTCEQIVYVHQSLPFVDYRFSFRDNRLFWIYQNIIGRNIIQSIKKAELAIVQTEWMKQACIEKAQVESSKVKVIPPNVNIAVNGYFEPNERSLTTFFYPANGMEYKNHQLIIDAARELKRVTNQDYEIIFTLNGNENEYVATLYRQVQEEQLPIRFEGAKTREEVFGLYTKAILLFPSYIETFGLPLLEARLHKGVVLASNTSFSKEILKGYENGKFFDPFNPMELCLLMKQYLQAEIEYKPMLEVQQQKTEENLLTKTLIS